MFKKTIVDIGGGDIDIYVNGQLVLHIGQVSDDECINLFFCLEGEIVESMIHKEDPTNDCKYELLAKRLKGGE